MIKFIIDSARELDWNSRKWQIVRSLLALSTLMTLLLSDFDRLLFVSNTHSFYFVNVNFFELFNRNFLIIKIIAIVSLCLVISGYFPKITSILHWWIAFSLTVSSTFVDGGDQICALLCMGMIPICFISSRKNLWNTNDVSRRMNIYLLIFLLFLFWLIRIQISMVYFQAATAKLSVTEWYNGTAAYYWLLHPLHGSPNWLVPFLKPILINKFGVTIITWCTLIFESVIAMTLFMSAKYRKYLFLPAILFHFCIVLIHGLSSFLLVMSAGLIILLLPFNTHSKRE